MMKIKKLILAVLLLVFVVTALHSHTYEEIVNMDYQQRIEVLKQMTPDQQKEYYEWKAKHAASKAAGKLNPISKEQLKKKAKDKKLEETMKSMNQN